MNATKEFLRSWLEENVGNLPAETEISVPMLAQQFEQDADAAGYGREVREQEVGNIEDAIQRALDKIGEENRGSESSRDEENSLAPVIDTLEAVEPEQIPRGPAGRPTSLADLLWQAPRLPRPEPPLGRSLLRAALRTMRSPRFPASRRDPSTVSKLLA
ncbi:DUF768 domain-containing protein [Mesorhizobium sp. M2A.F.Ca.ET.037.01.1.1]|uniref:DUF768 domain-containing protein n=1 Tax=unclassified Mesorhizobium TaxID=325217 RepID=UPI000FCA937F|nr:MULTISPECIES: DUF768 domain-containing protein [unclassified Mesorhizobium]RUX04706.1 DUF768 domain-containing protein [Mesorhizobium sp. M2A.F.Ca.ET.037.01.1.1]RUY12652.1 DUF768 domain-containing protein [Mesorhizobium sp. M2A.F.Ca.ET.040.01.1.1]RWA92324.1 MAG: DUF768 domain-containing protein [Mesorhizobium sp.]TIV20914.1 MAG: DUF768 domain-containing protein [Mesorhizobium sp.]